MSTTLEVIFGGVVSCSEWSVGPPLKNSFSYFVVCRTPGIWSVYPIELESRHHTYQTPSFYSWLICGPTSSPNLLHSSTQTSSYLMLSSKVTIQPECDSILIKILISSTVIVVCLRCFIAGGWSIILVLINSLTSITSYRLCGSCCGPVNSGSDDAIVNSVVCEEVTAVTTVHFCGVFFRWRSLRPLDRFFFASFESSTGHFTIVWPFGRIQSYCTQWIWKYERLNGIVSGLWVHTPNFGGTCSRIVFLETVNGKKIKRDVTAAVRCLHDVGKHYVVST